MQLKATIGTSKRTTNENSNLLPDLLEPQRAPLRVPMDALSAIPTWRQQDDLSPKDSQNNISQEFGDGRVKYRFENSSTHTRTPKNKLRPGGKAISKKSQRSYGTMSVIDKKK
eukprot:TRINITY_DN19607_c0_g1_i1.p1 TRINITY_DN19607_c0_g1~~TRINITY_DN19607_c0_g1_i1.p1  ORF type:complete len:113 (-),score=10.94 TRINITY_DN19607_c0_g1_i1:523-861(-)